MMRSYIKFNELQFKEKVCTRNYYDLIGQRDGMPF